MCTKQTIDNCDGGHERITSIETCFGLGDQLHFTEGLTMKTGSTLRLKLGKGLREGTRIGTHLSYHDPVLIGSGRNPAESYHIGDHRRKKKHLADLMTKALTSAENVKHCERMGVHESCESRETHQTRGRVRDRVRETVAPLSRQLSGALFFNSWVAVRVSRLDN